MTYEVDYQSGTEHFKEDRPEALKFAHWYTVTGRSSWAKVYAVDHGKRALIVTYDQDGQATPAPAPVAAPGARSRLSHLAERALMPT